MLIIVSICRLQRIQGHFICKDSRSAPPFHPHTPIDTTPTCIEYKGVKQGGWEAVK